MPADTIDPEPAVNCPRCASAALSEQDRDGVIIDTCPTCRGIWLDRGEFERLRARWLAELEQEFAGPGRGPDRLDVPPRRYDQDPFARARNRDDDDDDDDDGFRRRHPQAETQPRKRRWFEMFDLFD